MKKYNILGISLLLTMGVSISAFAQDDNAVDETAPKAAKKEVVKAPSYPMMEQKGVVVDAASKKPIPGVQVQTVGDDRFTAMTDAKGEFTIKVPTFATVLYVHTTQYLSQQVPVNKGKQLSIQLISDKFRKMYDNGTTVIASATTPVNVTTEKTVEEEVQNNLLADVRGISRSGGPGYGTAMFIRGLNSLNANAQPLIVVDGIIRDMQPTRTSLHDGDYNNLLLNINPEDIDNVTVLKNGTALYGAKGGNGVILINTKRGHSMATRIDANIGIGFELVPRLPKVMDADQYRAYATEMLGTYPDINRYKGQFHFLDTDGYYVQIHKYDNNTDWKDQVYKTALTQNYNINVQGGDDIGMYNLSVGYTDGKSTAKNNKFDRLNVRFNTDINVVKNITTRFDMSFTKINRDVFDQGAPEDFTKGPVSAPNFLALIKSPFLSPYSYNSYGNLTNTLSGADDYLTGLDKDLSLANPTAILVNGKAINKNRVENTEFYAAIAPKYQITKSLDLSETFSYTLNRISQRYYRPTGGVPNFTVPGVGSVQNLAMSQFTKEVSVTSDTRLNFQKQLGAHFLHAFGGFRYISYSYTDNQPQGQYTSGANDKTPNISESMQYKQSTGVDDSWKSINWYANVDYNYRNRYFAELTLTAEANSRFGDNMSGMSLGGVKWGLFPSVQLGWNLTNESWFPKTSAVNYLLLKAGYDLSGNDDISNYAARTSFTVHKYLNTAIAAQLTNMGNDEISYEKTNKFNVGLTSFFFNNRLGLDLNLFYHRTTNLLTLKALDTPVAGINNYWSNGGRLDNKGLEVTLTGKPIVAKDWNLEMGVSLGHYKNEVKELPNTTRLYVDGQLKAVGYTSNVYGTDNVATIIGKAAGVFYGYKTAGVFSTDAEAKAAGKDGYLYSIDNTGAKQYFKAGDVRFVDINGDGVISEADKTVIGDPNPDVYGNIFARLMYKHLTLTVGFNYCLGNDVFNYQRSILEGENNFYNQTTAVNNRWRYEGQKTSIPRLAYGDPMGNSRFSDRWIEDGSYLRLKTLNLTYKVPVSTTWLQGLSVWAEANNLFTITKYLGSDPEFSANNAVLYQGIDPGNVALGRTFTFGVKINL